MPVAPGHPALVIASVRNRAQVRFATEERIGLTKTEISTATAAIIALPILGSLASVVHLYGFAIGFGGGFATFLGVSDILSHGIKHLSATILSCVVSVLIVATYVKDDREIAIDTVFKKAAWIGIVAILLIIFPVAILYLSGLSPHRLISIIGISLLCGIIAFIILSGYLLDLDKNILHPLILLVMLSGGLFVSGGSIGYQFRHMRYDEATRMPSCGNYRVLKSVSSLYLAVQPNDQKVLVTEECEPRFVFPA